MNNKNPSMSHNACYELTRSPETKRKTFYSLSIRAKSGDSPLDGDLIHYHDGGFNSFSECLSYIRDVLVDLELCPHHYPFSSIQSFCIHKHNVSISNYIVTRKG